MKYLSKAIVSLAILFFMYKFLMIDVMLSVILGWMVIPIGILVIYEMMVED